MTDTVTVGQELQGQILETVRKSQEMAIEAIKTWEAYAKLRLLLVRGSMSEVFRNLATRRIR
jgi:hypothetical protein